jgi:hypothetical protein
MVKRMNEEILAQLMEKLVGVQTLPVTVIHTGGVKQHMDWIVGTTKYLSNLKKVIYDVSFLKLYSHNPDKILDGCFVRDNFLLKIDEWCHIDDPEHFLRILERNGHKPRGQKIYLDNNLYMEGLPFNKSDKIRNHLLRQRSDGLMWFDILKIVDPSDNVTLFLPSKAAIRKHEEALRQGN